MRKRLRAILGPVIILATIAVFTRYVWAHPAVVDKLKELNPWLVLAILGLYLLGFVALVGTQITSLRLCNTKLGRQENFLFSAYSSLVNFFGPGQSGPGFRTIYLRKRHGVRIKQYVFATLIYYGFYAVISAGMLLIGARPWWQTALALAAAAGFSWFVVRWYRQRLATKEGMPTGLTPANLGWLFVATAAQLAVQSAIYFTELHSVNQHVSFAQGLSYSGAANFSLFVALTPGAIGIRESFLALSQGLHHISNSVIVTANVIDRAIFILFLGLLFVFVLTLHAKDKLKISQIKTDKTKDNEPPRAPARGIS
jgi:uncharacterized membrane protein YbhN (UPF0104 family)